MSVKWETIKTAAQIAAERHEQKCAAVRAERDRLLSETDRYLLPDYPNKPVGIEGFRQLLRDITEQDGFPDNIIWPELPA